VRFGNHRPFYGGEDVKDRDEIETTLKAAFLQCEALFCPLNQQQKEILLEVFFERNSLADGNPLDELTSMQREILLEFILKQERENLAWKSSLLNDWLNDRPSGAVQFIRDQYGLAWLNSIKPIHWQEYLQKLRLTREKLQAGDTIEVSNGLWEWIPAALLVAVFAFKTVKNGKYKGYISGIALIGVF